MNKDIQKRIADIIDSACGGNRSEFCRKIGRDVSAVKDIIGGKKSAPSYGLLYDILSSDLGISPTWLMLGDGPMLLKDIEQKKSLIDINELDKTSKFDMFVDALSQALSIIKCK